MSIIYDALKKSQKNRAASQPVRIRQRLRLPQVKMINVSWKNMILILGILTSLYVMVMMLTVQDPPGAKRLFAQQQVIRIPVSKARLASAPRLMLEGVFLSENEQLAMINHRTYHVGDKVNGMQVVNIALDEVTLQDKKHSVVLRNTITALE